MYRAHPHLYARRYIQWLNRICVKFFYEQIFTATNEREVKSEIFSVSPATLAITIENKRRPIELLKAHSISGQHNELIQ